VSLVVNPSDLQEMTGKKKKLPHPRDLITPKYCKVLVAEDNKVNQKVAIYFMKKLGFEVEIAVNGLEAIEFVRNNKYDLVFMDCQMVNKVGCCGNIPANV
jgi:PleD family two-component response regulator